MTSGDGLTASDASAPGAGGEEVLRCDVVIVGAGPAGLAAARRLLAEDHPTPPSSIVMLDAGVAPGGQFWRQSAASDAPGGLRPQESADLHHHLDRYRSLVAALDAGRAQGRLRVLTQHHVWTTVRAADGTLAVHAVDRGGPPGTERAVTIHARALLIATGAFDRALPFPGWELPGVFTVGALQALLKANAVAAGQRVAVAGTGPFLLPVAAGLARRGVEVVGVFEANSPTRWLPHWRAALAGRHKLGEGLAYARVLARHRVPVYTRALVVAAHGSHRVERITVARLDRQGRLLSGTHREYAIDAVGVGWGFTPQLDLPVTLGAELGRDPAGTAVVRVDDAQRTSLPGVYAAGEVCGVGGAELALAQGALAAGAILADLAGRADPAGHAGEGAERRERDDLRRLTAFARGLALAYPTPPGWVDALTDSTTICRCEEVSHRQVRDALTAGAGDARQLKQLTRCGMGWCQGRVCGYAADLLTTGAPGAPVERLIAAPVPLGLLADGAGDTPTANNM